MIRRRRDGGSGIAPPREEYARWQLPDGSILIEEREVVPRRWWNRLTRPIGIVLIVGAVGWPIALLCLGWPRLALGFAIADLCVIGTGRDLIRWGAKRWRDDGGE